MQTQSIIPAQALEAIDAVISAQTRVAGDLLADPVAQHAGLRVDGIVKGTIRVPSGGVLRIGPSGSVSGELIEADYILIEGQVDARVVARRGLELADACTVKGSVEYGGQISVKPTAKVCANVQYNGDS